MKLQIIQQIHPYTKDQTLVHDKHQNVIPKYSAPFNKIESRSTSSTRTERRKVVFFFSYLILVVIYIK